MKIFGFYIISEKEHAELTKGLYVRGQIARCRRWFSGWKDLDIIWDYLLNGRYFDEVQKCCDKYAEARGTDCNGNSLQNHPYRRL